MLVKIGGRVNLVPRSLVGKAGKMRFPFRDPLLGRRAKGACSKWMFKTASVSDSEFQISRLYKSPSNKLDTIAPFFYLLSTINLSGEGRQRGRVVKAAGVGPRILGHALMILCKSCFSGMPVD